MDTKQENYETARKDLLSATYFFYEKIAFYSAGIISLSITFIGYIVSKPGKILFEEIFGIRLYQLLIISWIILLLSLTFSIAIRLWGAAYAARVAHREWLLKLEINLTGSYTESSHTELRKYIRKTSQKIEILKFITKHAGWISTVLFIIGTTLLLTFVILSFLKL